MSLFINFLTFGSFIYSLIFWLNKINLLNIPIKSLGDNFILQVWGHSHLANLLIFPIIYLIYQLKNAKAKLFPQVLLLAFFTITLFFTFSRSVIITLILTIFIINFQSVRQKILVLSLLLFGIMTLFYYSFRPTPTKDFSGSRLEYISQSLAAFKKSPIFGNGPKTFSIFNSQMTPPGSTYSSTPHNSFLNYLAGNGLIFTIIFFTAIIQSLYHQFRHNSVFFLLGFAGLICSLMDASWDNFGIFLISLIFIFHHNSTLTTDSSPKKQITTGLAILVFLFFIFKSTSDFFFFTKSYRLSLLFDPFNLNSILADINANPNLTLKLYQNEVVVYKSLIDHNSLPQSLEYYYQFIKLKPNDSTQQLMTVLNYLYLQKDLSQFLRFSQFIKVNNQNPQPQISRLFALFGQYLWKNNHQDQAINLFIKARDISPQWSNFHILLASAYYFSNQKSLAATAIEKCKENEFAAANCQQFLQSNQFDSPDSDFLIPSL